MARITVEDCLKQLDNRFGLIHLAAKRVRQLRKGSEPLVVCKNNDVVVSLREIAAGRVFQMNSGEKGYLEEGSLMEKENSVEKELLKPIDEESPGQDHEDRETTIKGE